MINVNMTDKAGVTLATAGKYCADNVKVTPSAGILRKDEQAKTATPTTIAQDITPDAGKALSKVTVNPITAAIVGDLDADSFAPAIVAAIEGKGVTVPDGTLLDGMAALIESIEAGGGANVTAGTITVTSDTNDFILTHGLGEIPAFFAIGMASKVPANKTYILIGGFGFGNINVQCRVSATASSNAPNGRLDANSITNGGLKSSFDEATAQTIMLACKKGYQKLISGVTYYWVAAGSGAF